MLKRKDGGNLENPLSRPNLKGEIEFKNVSFTYQVQMNQHFEI